MPGLIRGLAALSLAMLGAGAAYSAGTTIVGDPETIVRSAGQQRTLTQGAELLR